jgi:hypothetical protein
MQTQILGDLPDAPMIVRHVALDQTERTERIVHRV